MKIPPDFLLYRKKLKSQAALWRNIALAVMTLFALYYVLSTVPKYYNKSSSGNRIARVSIESEISEDRTREEKLKKIADNDKIKAVIVHINSPGGTVFGGESTYYAIREIAHKKPVVVVMGSFAASAGYMVSIAADYIIARNSTLTGSIGVLFISADVTEFAKKLGIKPIILKSGRLKAEPLPFKKMDEEVREYTMETIMDNYEIFVNMVSERRKLSKKSLLKIADGRVMTGRQALSYNLIDEIGGEDVALKWLHEKKSINKGLKVVDVSLAKKKRMIDQLLIEPLDSTKAWIIQYFNKVFLDLTNRISTFQ
jgi:protease IV